MRIVPCFVSGLLLLATSASFAQDDIADVKSEKRTVGDEKRKSYFLIPPAAEKTPDGCFGLLVVMPGGDGSEGFHPFVKRIRKHAVANDFVVVQPIAFKWSDDQSVVWPTELLKVPMQEFSTEEFVEAVIKDVATIHKIDPKRVLCMGWSSSGPAVYSLALREKSVVSGSYVSMSVYKPQQLPPLTNAKGRSIYIEHSPDDRVCPYLMAQRGHEELKREGARTTLVNYEGGHGWRGNVYLKMKDAFKWLQQPPVEE